MLRLEQHHAVASILFCGIQGFIGELQRTLRTSLERERDSLSRSGGNLIARVSLPSSAYREPGTSGRDSTGAVIRTDYSPIETDYVNYGQKVRMRRQD